MAVLDAISVTVAVIMQMMNMIASGGKLPKPASCIPSHSDKPDSFEASDRAKPPPALTIALTFRMLMKVVDSRDNLKVK